MSGDAFIAARRLALQIVVAQVGASAVVAALFAAFGSVTAGYSALVGGAIGALSSLYMALYLFRGRRANDPKRIMRAMYFAEATKMVITILLFLAVIVWLSVDVAPLFCGYIVTFVVYWLALLKNLPDTQG